MALAPLLITVFSDYICPFCYINDLRLQKLNQYYDLKINWCFLEIHPENPQAGRPIQALGYTNDQVEQMVSDIEQFATEEGITIRADRLTTNSRKALLIAEASKKISKQTFYQLHHLLFHSYFTLGQNIAEEDILLTLCQQIGIPPEFVKNAWTYPQYHRRLQNNLLAANELAITSVPTTFIGDNKHEGVLSIDELLQLADKAQTHFRKPSSK